ncbi:MAG: glycosyltransferase [Bacteroidia bacterium]
MKLGIPLAGFMDWGGGIDFLRIILKGLHAVKEKYHLEIFILIPEPRKESWIDKGKLLLKKTINFISFSKRFETNYPVHQIEAIQARLKMETPLEFLFYQAAPHALEALCEQHKIEVVLPSFFNLGAKFKTPWVGYIPDFQHKYYPEFFSKKEFKIRDGIFSKYLEETYSMIVNAKAVKQDIYNFHPSFKGEVFALPFCPLYTATAASSPISISHFNLPAKYFLISNQFWKHKDHATAFKALAKFIQNGNTDTYLVCTGSMSDYRFPAYISYLQNLIDELGIKNHLFLLGYILKEEQKEIMKNAIALIQPTLFEGGPGGGAVYEALAMGVPVLMSDIPVNKEIESPIAKFFKTGDEQDLALQMKEITAVLHLNPESFKELQIKETLALGEQLMEAAHNAISYVKKA